MRLINPIIPGEYRYPTITPFTIPDGHTYLKTLERLVECMRKLIDSVNENNEEMQTFVIELINSKIDEINTAFTEFEGEVDDKLATVDTKISELETFVNTEIGDLETFVNDSVQQIINNSIELQDTVLSGIIGDEDSESRQDLNVLYADKATQVVVETGRLSETQLGEKIAESTGTISDLKQSANPQFERVGNTPVITAAMVPGNELQGSIYWPSVIRAADYLSTPIDDYYCYVSSDHGSAGGIGLFTAPSPVGPWTWHSKVYTDTIGNQTETPEVYYLEGESRPFQMLYQQQGSIPGKVAGQVTLRASSVNGVSWVREGIAIDIPHSSYVLGETHTGYQRIHWLDGGWITRGLCGGGDQGKQSLWYSEDGKTFEFSNRVFYMTSMWGDDALERAAVTGYFTWRGTIFGYGYVSSIASGTAERVGTFSIAPMTDDLAGWASKPMPALTGTPGAWESTGSLKSVGIYQEGEAVYMYYQLGNSIGVAKAVAS